MKSFLVISFLMVSALFVDAGVIVLEGHYQNRNIFIQNSISNTGVGYCTFEVSVNGQIATDELNANAFEIDLTHYKLNIGAPITVLIKYKDDGCYPKVLNPEVLKPNPTFETTYITVESSGNLKWTTIGETAKLPFIVEQFKWNKWVQVGEVEGSGSPTTNFYNFKTSPTSGMNKFRVKQKGFIDKVRYSPSVQYISTSPDVSYVYNRKKQMVEFSDQTSYEVYDKFGRVIKKGFNSQVDVSNLSRDVYYMNFGNKSGEFRKR